MAGEFPKATIFSTEVRRLTSQANGQDYAILIWFPASYAGSTQTYPVVYITDGDLNFGLVPFLATSLMWDQKLPEVILVGIGYEFQSYEEWGLRRNNDLCPTAVEGETNSGGAVHFLEFLVSEVIPFINTNYRTDPNDMTLAGYSYGGLFSLYALLQKPGIFKRCLAGSPSVEYDHRWLFKREQEFSLKNSSLPGKLFMSVGALEGDSVAEIHEFHDVLGSRNYKGLDLSFLEIDGETHLTGIARSWLNGLQILFENGSS